MYVNITTFQLYGNNVIILNVVNKYSVMVNIIRFIINISLIKKFMLFFGF